MTRSIRYCLQVLSPMHIGCDEVYEPMAFFLDEAAQTLCPFDPMRFITGLDKAGQEEFQRICGKGTILSILELYKFIRRKGNADLALHKISVCSGLVDNYRRTMDLPANNPGAIRQELNNFAIFRTAFVPTSQRPYIPGSAIKGALRTAYLNALSKGKGRLPSPQGKGAARELERILLDGGSFDTDPFRLLKVSDFHPVGEVRTRIVYAVNRKKQPSKLKGFEGRGPFQILEIIQPGAVFEGTISVSDPPPRSGVVSPLTMEALQSSAGEFYGEECRRENEEMKKIGAVPLTFSSGANGIPLRMGRHSGAECVTIQGHRVIKIMLGKGQGNKYEKAATTLWLAGESGNPKENAGLKPFGWVSFREVSENLWLKLDALEAGYRQKLAGVPSYQNDSSVSRTYGRVISPETRPSIHSENSATKAASSPVKRPETGMPATKSLLSQATAFRLDDKIAFSRVIKALDALEDQEEARKIAEVIRKRLVEAGTWKKHPLRGEIECYLEV